jgi:chromosome segregation ATPase
MDSPFGVKKYVMMTQNSGLIDDPSMPLPTWLEDKINAQVANAISSATSSMSSAYNDLLSKYNALKAEETLLKASLSDLSEAKALKAQLDQLVADGFMGTANDVIAEADLAVDNYIINMVAPNNDFLTQAFSMRGWENPKTLSASISYVASSFTDYVQQINVLMYNVQQSIQDIYIIFENKNIDFTAYDTRISTSASELASVSGAIGQVGSDVQTISSDMSTLTTTVNDLNTTVSDYENRIANLEYSVSDHESRLVALGG